MERIGTKERTVSLFFLLWKEWIVSVRYKRVERTKIRSEGGRTKGVDLKERFGGLMDEWNDLKKETGSRAWIDTRSCVGFA